MAAFCRHQYWPRRRRRPPPQLPIWLWVVLVGVGIAAACMAALSMRVYPVLSVVAADQINNQVNGILTDTVAQVLQEMDVGYEEIVRLQRDESGQITSASSDIVTVNAVRSAIVSRMVERIEDLDLSQVELPVGNLLGLDLLSGLGPSLRIQALWVGTVTAEVEQQFLEAGINQTFHRVMLSVQVPVEILLPGGTVETTVDAQVCLAESIIVGAVPGTYIQLDK